MHYPGFTRQRAKKETKTKTKKEKGAYDRNDFGEPYDSRLGLHWN